MNKMMINRCIFTIVILTVYMQHCVCQVCTRHVFIPKTYQEPYVHTYKERYQANCWYGSCTKTRMKSVIDYKTVTKNILQEVIECCPDYLRKDTDTDSDSDEIICIPICMPSCINATCSAPGICTCMPGYDPDPETLHTCNPVCSEPCDNGICVQPDTCQCNFGYSLTNKTCTPICTEPCVNGRCILPDTCACNEGYRKSEDNNCEPYCSKGCANSFCASPENCQCIEGYTKYTNDDLCSPVCEKGCDNGTCVSPDKCLCDPGFEIKNDTCEPVCTDCHNGQCVAPDVCECNSGFELANNSCEPVCFGCENGKCLAPYDCECEEGYTRNAQDIKCEPICIGCEGVCIEPSNCICNPPLVARHENGNGQDCNCFINCTDSLNVCKVTKCINGNTNGIEKKINSDIHANKHSSEDYYYYDEENSYKTESIEGSSYTSTVNYMDLDIMTTKSDMIDKNYTAGNQLITELNHGKLDQWLYIGIAVLTLIVVTLILLVVVKKKTLSKYFSGGTYIVEDGSKTQNDCRPSTSFDMRFSSIEKSAKERD